MQRQDRSAEDLRHRINRIYAAVNRTAPSDAESVRLRVISRPRGVLVEQDFRGGLSKDDIREYINALLFHISHLRDSLKAWATSNERDSGEVERCVGTSRSLQICVDLADRYKHVGPPRNGRGRSGIAPSLGEVERVLQLVTGPGPGSHVGYALVPDKQGRLRPKVLGDGTAEVVYTGDVIDRSGDKVGDVMQIAREAVEAWEALLRRWGVLSRT